MDLREGNRHDAADVQEGDASRLGRIETLIASDEKSARYRWGQLCGASEAENRCERDKASVLCEPQQGRGDTHQVQTGEEGAYEEPAQAAFLRTGRSIGAPNLRPGRLHELAVPNARRTDGLARAAVQALPHLFDEAGAQYIESRFADRLDETDATARPGRLRHCLEIRRA